MLAAEDFGNQSWIHRDPTRLGSTPAGPERLIKKGTPGTPRLPPAAPAPIILAMKKPTTSSSKQPAAKSATKSASKPLVAVRTAAQKPVHATRSAIRRAVRSVAEERHRADA